MKTRKLPKELVSPNGDLRAPPPDGIPESDERIEPVISQPVKFKCGHNGLTFHAVRLNGDTIHLRPAQIEEQAECAGCVIADLKKSTCRCALCGRRILEGMPVAPYELCEGFREDAARVTIGDKTCVLGCPRCAPGPEFLNGLWSDGRYLSSKEMERLILERMGIVLDDEDPDCEKCPGKGDCPEYGKKGDCVKN